MEEHLHKSNKYALICSIIIYLIMVAGFGVEYSREIRTFAELVGLGSFLLVFGGGQPSFLRKR